MEWEELFRRRIRELIEERYESIDRFYLERGISKGHVYEIISGKTSPTLKTLKRLAVALEVDVRDFFILPERSRQDRAMELLRQASPAAFRDAVSVLVADAEARPLRTRRRRGSA